MRRWLILSIGIVILLIFGSVLVVRALFPPPIPDPPLLVDAPVGFHLNEIDLATSSAMLISLDNRSDETITIDLAALGQAVSCQLRLFHPLGDEWKWIDADGRTANPTFRAAPLLTDMNWRTQTTLTIAAGRSESAMLTVEPSVGLIAARWVARMRGQPQRLVYLIDMELPIRGESAAGHRTVRVAAKEETSYLPRP